ncbi:single-strand DNA-binding protein [Sporomusaceae bacterium BoRhaA]|uniref:single-stranded DNA-binding protein n=1 Tax=Pelorhabdus rhamnosifermentans TaxID=2772457 RepID=UPI001C0633B8|nr:single-stranded DNA-binding protein [Pelorhabdus rhamnosifermentans]MBU2704100.1 single-strand DNA-binding protein [Pelorhabdus rhamnosifermentans]
MNSIVISGRFTDNPESKTAQDGKAIAHFNLADNYGQDKVSFFRCSAFGKMAELILNSCQKGHKLVVSGRMEEQQWTDNTGQKQRAWQCNINTIDFCEPKQQQSTPAASAPRANTGYGTPPATQGYGAPPAPNGYAAPPAPTGPQYAAAQPGFPPVPAATPQTQFDPQGNQWQVINGAWQMIKPTAPAAPTPGAMTFPPAGPNTPF